MSIFLLFILVSCSYAAEKLSSYNVDPSETSISGLSSGAFFATQFQVAYSSSIKGVGIIAGGPYDCASGSSYTSCMYSSSPPITKSIANTKTWSGKEIDHIRNLSYHKVYMISGSADTTVSVSVMNQLYKYYVTDGQLIPSENVIYKKDLKSAHTFPTNFDSTGNNGCGTGSSPYISNCGFDGAGVILQHIYGPLQTPNQGGLNGKFIQINQGEFLSNSKTFGMSDTAWIYLPKTCEDGQTCKLHIAVHGCLQGYEKIGDKYVKNTGYNRWADTNNFIIFYPQTVPTSSTSLSGGVSFPNMNGCWDWVGWYGKDFSLKSGKQLSTMKKIIDRITAKFNPLDPPKDLQLIQTNDNSISLSWKTVNNAIGYNIYRNDYKVNQQLITLSTFIDLNLNSGTTYRYSVKSVSSSSTESVSSNVILVQITGQPPSIEPPSQITAEQITSNSVSLRWKGVSSAEKYFIYRNNMKIGDVILNSYRDNQLNSNTEYEYQISSVNNAGKSIKSEEIQIKTLIEKVCFNDNNYNHVLAGRARHNAGYVFALGSNQNMGLFNTFQKTNLCKIQENYYQME